MGVTLNRAGTSKQPEPEINVTPLVDVVLVLLIIFMVIAPAVNDGEHIELPAIQNPDAKPKDMDPVDVIYTLGGRILVEDQQVSRAELRPTLTRLHKEKLERELVLKADSGVPYKEVRGLLAELQTIGFRGLSLKVTQKKPGAS